MLKQCKETESSSDAMRSVDPATMLADYLSNKNHRDIYGDRAAMASINISMLEGTKHGRLVKEVDAGGLIAYRYDIKPGFEGKDRAVFMAEFEGKRYKIVIDLVVHIVFNENVPTCPPPKLIKVNNKSVSDASPYHLNSFTVSFGDLTGSSVGQTTGEGANAAITLDTTAAGHGWYVDPTPLDTTDDYLPTSNPNLWQAKAGSAAEGKMDMLSVLLHEYGHALGLEHSADSSDFMSATL